MPGTFGNCNNLYTIISIIGTMELIHNWRIKMKKDKALMISLISIILLNLVLKVRQEGSRNFQEV